MRRRIQTALHAVDVSGVSIVRNTRSSWQTRELTVQLRFGALYTGGNLLRIAYEDVRDPGLRLDIRVGTSRMKQFDLRLLQGFGFACALFQ
jgi:hypothetical protein